MPAWLDSAHITHWLVDKRFVALCGLVSLLIASYQRKRANKPGLSLESGLTTFFGGCGFSVGLLLLIYPFLTPPPNLAEYAEYIVGLGVALLVIAYRSVREAVDR